MVKHDTIVKLREKCKKLKLTGYSKLKKDDLKKIIEKAQILQAQKLKQKVDTTNKCPPGKIYNPNSKRCVSKTGKIGKAILDGTFIPKQNDGKAPTKQQQEKQKKQIQQLTNIDPLSQQKENQISQYFTNPPNMQEFCKNKTIYEMKKLLLKTKFQILLSYYNYDNPDKRHDTKQSKILSTNHQLNIPEFLTFGLQDSFYPMEKNKFITIDNFMDQEWFVKQNEYINSLNSFQRAVLFAFSNNSFTTITPFSLESIKPNPDFKTTKNKYKSWVRDNSNANRVHPLKLALIIVSHDSNWKKQFSKKKKALTLLEKIKDGNYYDTSALNKFITDHVDTKEYVELMTIYMNLLQSIFEHAPPVQKSFYLFRKESSLRFDKLLIENKINIKNDTFISTSNDGEFIKQRVGSEYVRLKIHPGLKILFIRGCSYYKKENEFVIAPCCFENITKNTFNKITSSNSICNNDLRRTIYDVDVKPLKK